MPRNSGASAAEKGETIAGAKDAQTRTKSPSNASHAASVIASVLKKPPPSSRGSLRAETARSAADAHRDVRAQTSHGKKAVDPDPTAERSHPPPPTTAAAANPISNPPRKPDAQETKNLPRNAGRRRPQVAPRPQDADLLAHAEPLLREGAPGRRAEEERADVHKKRAVGLPPARRPGEEEEGALEEAVAL